MAVNPLVAIDVGSSKVHVLIGESVGEDEVKVLGVGRAANLATRRGSIVNVEVAVQAIKLATEEAEIMAGCEIESAYVGTAGVDIRCINSRSSMQLGQRRDREITAKDTRRVVEAAKSPAIPSDRVVLHAIPQEFEVNEQSGIADPVGMQGTRLEVAVHLVTANATPSRTLLTSVNRAGVEVLEMVFEPLATAEAVLTWDERELGVLLIDVGTGTSEYSLFADGYPQHSAVLPLGSHHFTNDLAMVLRTPFADAEEIKIERGCCMPNMVADEEGVSIAAVGGGAARVVPRRELCDILQPRAEELLTMIRDDLFKHGYVDPLRGGVVLTGGGSQLDGLLEMTEEVFDSGVRYGLPQGLSGLPEELRSPEWTTAAGLLMHAHQEQMKRRRGSARSPLSVRGMVGSLREILRSPSGAES